MARSPNAAPTGCSASRGLYAQMWNRQREATEAEERARQAANDAEGFVKRGLPAAE